MNDTDAAVPSSHYENFPVASLLLPRRLRPAVKAIYAFARGADDAADEGERTPAERLALLAGFREGLHGIARGAPRTPLFQDLAFQDLARAVRAHGLPLEPFHALLDAFTQDVIQTRYASFPELAAYCRKSADPVGRLMLALFGADTPANRARSDAVCTALQLINFLQDVREDHRRGRVYLPQDELARFGVPESDLGAGHAGAGWVPLLCHQIARARGLLDAGAPLGRALPGRIGLEIRMITAGGGRVLDKLAAAPLAPLAAAPALATRLRARDWAAMLAGAIRAK